MKGVDMPRAGLERLRKGTLMELAEMYARNWQTLDGLWFETVEVEYGLEAAVRLDLKNWEKQSVIEAKRIKKVLKLDGGGLGSVLTALSFMSWQLVSPLFEYETKSRELIIFYYPHCPVQEGRKRQGKEEFPCKAMKLLLLSSLARVVEPRAMVKCLACPPDPHPPEFWCRWQLTMEQG